MWVKLNKKTQNKNCNTQFSGLPEKHICCSDRKSAYLSTTPICGTLPIYFLNLGISVVKIVEIRNHNIEHNFRTIFANQTG